MYLSRLQLNPAEATVWRDVVDHPHRLHQIVMQGFPDGVKRHDAHILHRLDAAEQAMTLLVQSDIQPDWSSLDERLLLPATPFDPIPNPAIQSLDGLALENGRILRFRLRANPTKRISSGKGNKPGPRVELYKEADQIEWLINKGKRHGFAVAKDHLRINPEGKQKDYRRRLTIYTALFDGILRVTDETAFNMAVQTGIGPAKAFGCGLLSLAPA